jgi:sigma-B regulation protein RsbU (phosphoserine phosphatase)
MLLVFSDGVTDAMGKDGTEFGEDRLLAFATSHRHLAPAAFLDRLLETIREFTIDVAQADDLTVLVLRRNCDRRAEGRP